MSRTKLCKRYEIREYQHGRFSTSMTGKLREYKRARKLVARLRAMGHDAFAAPMLVRS